MEAKRRRFRSKEIVTGDVDGNLFNSDGSEWNLRVWRMDFDAIINATENSISVEKRNGGILVMALFRRLGETKKVLSF